MTDRREDLLRVLQDAHVFYQSQVQPSWVPDHLNRRNLYPQLQPAQIGYAPGGWTTTVNHLRGRGHADEVVLEAGLAHQARTGQLVDFFRDRLMVPLRTGEGQLVGFIGRCPEGAGADVPKYLNSPRTAIFSKHELLYGLGEDAERLRRGSMPIIVEGPMDRLAITQAAQNLAVTGLAPCGTALTEKQVRALLVVVGPHRAIAVALDPDAAGRHATLRAWDLLTAAGAGNLLHVRLADGRDPADLVRQGRSSWLRNAISHHRPLAFAVANQRVASAHIDLDNIAQRVALAHHIIEQDLSGVPGQLVAAYLSHLAHRLDLDAETVTGIAVDLISAEITA